MSRCRHCLLYAAAWVALACTDNEAPSAPPAGSLTLTPVIDTLDAVGDTGQLVASVTGGSAGAVTWQSSDPATVEVSASGTVTARKAGTADVTARSGSVSAAARVTVRPPVAVVAASASRTQVFASTYRVTAALRNTGGRGAYRVEVYYRAVNLANRPAVLALSTDPVPVTAHYSASVSWEVRVAPDSDVDWFVVFSRGPNDAAYRETARFTF